jgi:pimeloyl-ACP methyl ester carboxylesterase
MDSIRIDLTNVSLSALTWGPTEGPLAVLLHGFPDTAHTWRYLGPALAEDGWRVVAPFLRGYAPSHVPTDGRSDVAALVSDVLAIHHQLGGGSDAVLVGHDWGAIATNATAAHEDNPFAKVVSLAVPPLAAISGAGVLRILPRQTRNSWYIMFASSGGTGHRGTTRARTSRMSWLRWRSRQTNGP